MGGAPLDAYLHVSDAGSVDSYVYPAVPFAGDADLDVPLVTSAVRGGLANEADVTLEAGKGLLYVFVRDCNGDPVEGATVTTNPPGALSYTAGFVPSPGRPAPTAPAPPTSSICRPETSKPTPASAATRCASTRSKFGPT